MYRVMDDHNPEPRAAKAAAATSISNMSAEKARFVPVEAEKSWSTAVPSANFFRSIVRVGASKDHRSDVDNSHRRTTASSVTVTSEVPWTPKGCQATDVTADFVVTCVVGPRVKNLGFKGSGSVRSDDFGSTQMCTVCVVRIAR